MWRALPWREARTMGATGKEVRRFVACCVGGGGEGGQQHGLRGCAAFRKARVLRAAALEEAREDQGRWEARVLRAAEREEASEERGGLGDPTEEVRSPSLGSATRDRRNGRRRLCACCV